MADIEDYEGLWRPASPVAAPHGARLLAFAVDLLVVLLVALAAGGGWLRVLGVFVAYHTALVWMTGQTIGKALANLEIRRIDGHAYERTARGLLWALGRASVGYLLVDILGLGILVALPRRNSARRCLHDWVFGSQVVLRGELEWAVPKMRKRLSDFASRREDASRQLEEAQAEPRRLSNLWQWLVTGALGLEKLLGILQHVVTQVSGWFGGAGQAHAGTATLSTKAAAGVAVGSGAATVGTVATIAVLTSPAAATVVGTWEEVGSTSVVIVVEQTESGSFVGRNTKDISKPAETACVWKAGLELWRLEGDGPDFDGQVRLGRGTIAKCEEFLWGDATFELDDMGTPDDPADDRLRYCTASAPSSGEGCPEYSRR